jgi:hypothetical protein
VKAPRHGFPLAVAAAFVILLIGYRSWTGAGFGLALPTADSEVVPTGFLYNLPDNFVYASFVKQAEQGSWLLTNLYATEDHGSIYFNPYFWIVGRVAHFSGLPVTGWMVVFGIAAAAITIVCSFHIALLAGLSTVAARWTTILVAFASGLSWPALKVARLLGRSPLVGADLSFQDAIPFSAACAYPYQSFSLALLALVILLALACETSPPGRFRMASWLALACAATLMGTSHPYEGVMVLGTHALYALRGGPRRRARLAVAGVLAVCLGSALAYSYWVSRQPVWRDVATNSTELWHPRSFWLVGYGLALPIAVLASIPTLRSESGPRWWLALWTALVALLLIGINVDQSKVSSGAFLPMSVLAGHGIATIAARLGRIRAAAARRTGLAFGILLSAGFFPTSAYLLARIYSNLAHEPGLVQAARLIADSDARFPSVLCDTHAGSFLPALAGARVFDGHWSMTPRSSSKRERLVEAGIQLLRGKAETRVEPRAFRGLIDEVAPEFILLAEDSRAIPLADALPDFERASSHDSAWRLWRRR